VTGTVQGFESRDHVRDRGAFVALATPTAANQAIEVVTAVIRHANGCERRASVGSQRLSNTLIRDATPRLLPREALPYHDAQCKDVARRSDLAAKHDFGCCISQR